MSDVILEVQSVTKSFGSLRALDDVSLTIHEGEILGLVGPNGSGKSTFINVLSGFLPLDRGEIRFGGGPIGRAAPHRRAGRGLGRTYQIPRPFMTLTVADNVAVGQRFGSRDRTRHVMGIDEVLEFVGLTHKAVAVASSLTLRERKQLELARALACAPRVIMLDEVLAGLNPTDIESAIDLVRRIRGLGLSVLFVEHNMRAVTALCDRLVVLQSGTLLAEGEPLEVLRRPDVITAYLGTHHA